MKNLLSAVRLLSSVRADFALAATTQYLPERVIDTTLALIGVENPDQWDRASVNTAFVRYSANCRGESHDRAEREVIEAYTDGTSRHMVRHLEIIAGSMAAFRFYGDYTPVEIRLGDPHAPMRMTESVPCDQ